MSLIQCKHLKFAHYILCISAALCLSIWCIYNYSLDEDLTRIDFKRFNEQKDDIYPSISVCLCNPYISKKLKKYGNDITPSKYIKFLQGDMWQQEMLDIDYEDVTIDIKDYFLGYDITYSNNERVSYKSQDDIEPGTIGWRLPYATLNVSSQKCFTVDIPFQPQKILRQLNIRIKTSIFPNKTRPAKLTYNPSNGDVECFSIYFHYPMQMTAGKGIEKSSWPIREKNDSKAYTMFFKLKNIEVIHNRNKRMNPCIEYLSNHDKHTFQKFVEMAGCRPPYIKTNTTLTVCTTKEEMKKTIDVSNEYRIARDNFDKIPCRNLGRLDFGYREYDLPKDRTPSFNITLYYGDSKYREIRQVRAFGLHALFGNIGGYVGIFIGYALFQLPDLVMKIMNFLRRKEKNDTNDRNGDKEECSRENTA